MTAGLLANAATAGAACALLSACGSGQAASTRASGSSTHAAAAAARSADPPRSASARRRPSRAQALAFVRAVNLSVGDVPEASVETKRSAHEDAAEHREERGCEKGVRQGAKLVEGSSPKLKRGKELEVEQITSSVEVMRSERTIAGEFASVASPALRECFARVVTRNLQDKPLSRARWGRVTVSKLAVDAPGASDTAGLRITVVLNLPYSEVSVPMYFDVMAFAVRPAEVTLSTFSLTQPVPATTEQELVSLLLARAKAQPL
jgi:hypothetical protein